MHDDGDRRLKSVFWRRRGCSDAGNLTSSAATSSRGRLWPHHVQVLADGALSGGTPDLEFYLDRSEGDGAGRAVIGGGGPTALSVAAARCSVTRLPVYEPLKA